MTTTTPSTITRPKKVFAIGSVQASIWKRTTSAGWDYYSVQMQRSYRTADGEREYTESFDQGDLLNLAELARRAEAWIAEQRQL